MWTSSNWIGYAHQFHIQMCSEKNGIFSLQKVNGSDKILQNLQLCFVLQAHSKTKGFEFLDEMRCTFVLLLVGLFSDLNSDQKPFKFSICLLVGSRYCGRLIKWIIRTPNISEAEICKQEWHYFVWYLKTDQEHFLGNLKNLVKACLAPSHGVSKRACPTYLLKRKQEKKPNFNEITSILFLCQLQSL